MDRERDNKKDREETTDRQIDKEIKTDRDKRQTGK